mmetsp:Transcript_69242/g.166039  ORF Transcript_69242/g.166039 Transcript_69242/m.166039 type:complete len:239 (-) Transcript_69242:38-754(-)
MGAVSKPMIRLHRSSAQREVRAQRKSTLRILLLLGACLAGLLPRLPGTSGCAFFAPSPGTSPQGSSSQTSSGAVAVSEPPAAPDAEEPDYEGSRGRLEKPLTELWEPAEEADILRVAQKIRQVSDVWQPPYGSSLSRSEFQQRAGERFGFFEAKPSEAAFDAVFDSFNSGSNWVDTFDKMDSVVQSWYKSDGSFDESAVLRSVSTGRAAIVFAVALYYGLSYGVPLSLLWIYISKSFF